MALADRYDELMQMRTEALRKYGARSTADVWAPPARLSVPACSTRKTPMRSTRFWPVWIYDKPPLVRALERHLNAAGGRLDVLEYGPGRGLLAAYLRERYPTRIGRYYGVERDRSVTGPYERVAPRDLPAGIDVVIASEVVEHMSLDECYEGVLIPASASMRADGAFFLSTPNALAPGAISRDATHVQGYPWYDLYALLRLVFGRVSIYRAYYAWSAGRLLRLLPRIALTWPLELDWCDTLVCIATQPRPATRAGGQPG